MSPLKQFWPWAGGLLSYSTIEYVYNVPWWKSKIRERNNKNEAWRWSQHREQCAFLPWNPAESPLPTGPSAPWVLQDGCVIKRQPWGPLACLTTHWQCGGVAAGLLAVALAQDRWVTFIISTMVHLPTLKPNQRKHFARLRKCLLRIGTYFEAPI